jgi:hypothetical protein
MKPGSLVKLTVDRRRYDGVDHVNKRWFLVLPEHIGMYVQTIRLENKLLSDIILINESLVRVAPGVMESLKIED